MADGRLYLRAEDGAIVLVEPNRKEYIERGRFEQADRTRSPAWTHPVIANGKLHDPNEAERVLAERQGDFVAIAKGALADPEWPRKIAANEAPVPFDPGMITPLATIDNVAAWRARQAAPSEA